MPMPAVIHVRLTRLNSQRVIPVHYQQYIAIHANIYQARGDHEKGGVIGL